ncbi:hypothetical protein D3C71_1329480 [compost metagenome]
MLAVPEMRAGDGPAGGGASLEETPSAAPFVLLIEAPMPLPGFAAGAPADMARACAMFDWIWRAASESAGSSVCRRSQCTSASAASPRRSAIMPASARALGWSGSATSACATAAMASVSGLP